MEQETVNHIRACKCFLTTADGLNRVLQGLILEDLIQAFSCCFICWMFGKVWMFGVRRDQVDFRMCKLMAPSLLLLCLTVSINYYSSTVLVLLSLHT